MSARTETLAGTPPREAVRAARGTSRSCKGWHQEAALRMLMNNLDPEVAERWQDLVVYGGTGKAARSWEAFHAIVRSLRSLEQDETLLVQSGKPVGIAKTHPDAPRVLIANSLLVPAWARWDEFRRLEAKGLTMYGQMTAGSWIYIGTQGILQGTYETFAEAARQHFGGTLRGRWTLTAGLGGMGGAQPLAVTMNEGVCLAVEVDPERVRRRVETRYLDKSTSSLEEALRWVDDAVQKEEAVSIGLVANAAEALPELARRGARPDLVTDQTSAHDELNGYVPAGLSLADALELRRQDPKEYSRRAVESMGTHVRAMLRFLTLGSITFDYGNNIRGQAVNAGVSNAFDIPGFVLLRRERPLPVGRALRKPRRHRGHRSRGARALSGERAAPPVDPARLRAGTLPGTSGAHLLARDGRAGAIRGGDPPSRRARRGGGTDRDRARSSGLRLGGLSVPRNGSDARRE